MAPRAILIGMPGAGKSTVGRLLAERLRVPFVDSDALIRKETKRNISDIFTEDGEIVFRQIEARIIQNALQDFTGVLSLGGGAVLDATTRQALASMSVLLIDASDDVLIERITNSRTVRPLLQSDPVAGIRRLRKDRMAIYQSLASHTFCSDSKPVAHVVDEVYRVLTEPERIVQVAGEHPYDVHIGAHLVPRLLSQASSFASVMVVCAPDVIILGKKVCHTLQDMGTPACLFEVPRAEDAKEIDVLAKAWDFAGENHIGRDGVVVGIGGGATTDLAGFIAATWLRGVAVIHMPTTLLAMVDAAVGGKTGINTRHGKNLVGSFYPPYSVLCDVECLDTLPYQDLLAGFGEIIKCGFIADIEILNTIAKFGKTVVSAQHPALISLIEMAVAVKARVVGEDLKESGLREILNYGHTLAHSIELAENYRYRHGYAVAIGCVFAAALAEAEGIAAPGFTDFHRNAFASVGLPVEYSHTDAKELLASMYSDKKVRANQLRFVVLADIAQPQILVEPSEQSLEFAFAKIGITA
ncbi:3-dehydroquinate synthase [Arcanobacterium bovis]|uniref:Multifunctional fusion protein n=1 Tax=Arcanobacterium bovis TaxID=2529275 RepID=A0A4Q9V362_9ACTO|nr:3-dehydroquinate synthase [Arcanobacterium bovis]TBW22912.1 3-dehydroquinate synthase [Arcanobacterium bovis]